jgi:hypothetical protein
MIFAVNSKAESVEWSCQFDGFGAPVRAVKAEALCDTQDTRQTDVMNYWSAPERIRTVAASGFALTKVPQNAKLSLRGACC